eukprot:GILJ01006113.1.p1 GENE.GILJ01006113.1~~GILJ01006113.1.p1  ORF type:complete len:253 (-),score=39.67 GILJ01006113.1:753-1511(-)
MPKVTNLGQVLIQYNTQEEDQKEDNLTVFYCIQCQALAFITDCDLSQLPRRRTDNAMVLDVTQRVFKPSMTAPELTVVTREKGKEKQFRLHCATCRSWIAYFGAPPELKPPLLYIVNGTVKFDSKVEHNAQYKCSICGFVARSGELLEAHGAERNHHAGLVSYAERRRAEMDLDRQTAKREAAGDTSWQEDIARDGGSDTLHAAEAMQPHDELHTGTTTRRTSSVSSLSGPSETVSLSIDNLGAPKRRKLET